jgi:rhodanese-related sulfurtransferase
MIKQETSEFKTLAAMSDTEQAAWEQREVRFDGVPEVTTDWLKEWFEHFRVIDIRQPEELLPPIGHIDQVEHIEMYNLPNEVTTWNPDVPVILICRTGSRTAYMSQFLQQNGFSQVASVRGGMFSWHQQGYPVSYEM